MTARANSRYSVDGDLCGPCLERSAEAAYIQMRSRESTSAVRMGTWTNSADALRERQWRHRLREKVQPKVPAHSNSHPWELGGEAVDLLHRIKRGLPVTSPVLAGVEECAELIRMLA
jgi:hypothetical protein